jgi:hypothetical protein
MSSRRVGFYESRLRVICFYKFKYELVCFDYCIIHFWRRKNERVTRILQLVAWYVISWIKSHIGYESFGIELAARLQEGSFDWLSSSISIPLF